MKIDVLRFALTGATVAFLLSAAACSPKPQAPTEESSAAADHTPGDIPDGNATARQDAEAAVAAAMAASPTASDTSIPTAPASEAASPAAH